MRLSPPPRLAAIWQRLPFRAMLLVVLFLFLVKERYPFSNFPMYSRVDAEADILYVTDQEDQALPMDALFRTGSGTAKKMYKSELNVITKNAGRDLKTATVEDRISAGRVTMDTIWKRIRLKEMPAGVSQLRLYRKTFRLEDGRIAHLKPERLAELPFPAP